LKGLEKIPSQRDFLDAYEALSACIGRAGCMGAGADAGKLVTWAEWSRFDPRLGEMIAAFFAKKWREIPVGPLKESLFAAAWPQALGVVLEFAALVAMEVQGPAAQGGRRAFRHWAGAVMEGVSPASWECFFIGLRPPGSETLLDDARLSLTQYKRWGYLGREVLINKAARLSGKITLVPAETRRMVLNDLAREHSRITTRIISKRLAAWLDQDRPSLI